MGLPASPIGPEHAAPDRHGASGEQDRPPAHTAPDRHGASGEQDRPRPTPRRIATALPASQIGPGPRRAATCPYPSRRGPAQAGVWRVSA